MERRIPGDEAVGRAVREALRARPMHSQQELLEAVQARLRKEDPAFAVSAERVRRVAAQSGVAVRVSTRVGRAPAQCPACAKALDQVFFKNLAGARVLTGLRCSCGYRGSGKSLAPGRYGFALR